MDTATIAKVQRLGFRVYMRRTTDSWMIFTSQDGKRLGYLQEERLGGPLSISTVHKPNSQSGTGFSINQWVSDLTREELESGFRSIPSWAGEYELRSVEKWKDISAFIAANAFNREYGLVPPMQGGGGVMSSYTGPATILGGLPVIATVHWYTDSWTGEHDFDIQEICWAKRDGSAGKPVSQKILDRAEKHDPYFCNLNEQLSEQAACEAAEARGETYPEPQEMISLDPDWLKPKGTP